MEGSGPEGGDRRAWTGGCGVWLCLGRGSFSATEPARHPQQQQQRPEWPSQGRDLGDRRQGTGPGPLPKAAIPRAMPLPIPWCYRLAKRWPSLGTRLEIWGPCLEPMHRPYFDDCGNMTLAIGCSARGSGILGREKKFGLSHAQRPSPTPRPQSKPLKTQPFVHALHTRHFFA